MQQSISSVNIKYYPLQVYSIIGNIYSKDEESVPAMALYKFFQVYSVAHECTENFDALHSSIFAL